MDAGSGTDLLSCIVSGNGLRALPVIPGCTRTALPCCSAFINGQLRDRSTRMPSVTDWPDKLVPPVRKVSEVLVLFSELEKETVLLQYSRGIQRPWVPGYKNWHPMNRHAGR